LNAIQAIKLSMQKLTDDDVDVEEKGVYICWLFHLVGDVHQPLHSSAMFSRVAFPNGDKGGNDIPTNAGKLHGFWDKLLGTGGSLNTIRNITGSILDEDDLVAAGQTALEDLNPEVWVDESHTFCKDTVYSDAIREAVSRRESGDTRRVESVDLDGDYKAEAGSIARRRVAQAGYRLASLLSQIAAANEEGTVNSVLKIAALKPDPAGFDRIGEVVRIRNTSNDAVPLDGWKVRDDDGDVLFLDGEVDGMDTEDIIDVNNHLPLSNRGETVELLNPAGQVVHRVTYTRSQVEEDQFINFD